jgi:hypothetical protein
MRRLTKVVETDGEKDTERECSWLEAHGAIRYGLKVLGGKSGSVS